MPPFYNLGLLGYPVNHSFSPALHKAALYALGLDGDYKLYPVPPFPEGQKVMAELLGKMRIGEIQGLNVTIPHKQGVMPLLDTLSVTAREIGAVNVISEFHGKLVGENTDSGGFGADLNKFLGSRKVENVLVLGAGGSARAVVFALAQMGCRIWLAARRLEKAQELAAKTGININRHPVLPIALTAAALFPLLENCNLIVNTTPAGMFPNIDASAWPKGLPLPRHAAVYDLIYNPPETLLVKTARLKGLPTVNGLGMLVEQASLAFQNWTGLNPPTQVMWQAVSAISQSVHLNKG